MNKDYKKENIHKIRKEIMSEITQTLIYFEHLKGMLNVIIRSSIFTSIDQIHDSTIINILTYNDNISLLCNKTIAIYELTNREDKVGLLVLKALTSKLRILSSTRNHLAHSKSVFKVVQDDLIDIIDDLDTVEIQKSNLGDEGYKSRRKRLSLETIKSLNENIHRLSKGFDSFIFTFGKSAAEKIKMYEQEMKVDEIKALKLEL